MSKRDVKLLLGDIYDSGCKIVNYTSGLSYEQFIADDKTVDATVRNFEIIGEAAKRVPADFKLVHPEVEWQRLTGLRNKIIHEYFGIEYETIWMIIKEYLPELIAWVAPFAKDK